MNCCNWEELPLKILTNYCYDTLNVNIIANFEADTIAVIQNEPLQFINLSLGNATLWEWDFENDGVTDSYEQNPVWVYNEPGSYSVLFTVSDGVNENTYLIENYVSVFPIQILNIPAGWSGVSTYLNPLNKGVEGMFSPFGNDFVILASMTDFYYPAAGVNTIGNWNYATGYQVKAANNLELPIAGSKIGNPTLELVQGWNLIPVLNNCNNPVEELFNTIIDNLQIVKEVAGAGVYWPQFGVNTLGELIPGKAYFVLVDEDVELEFFPCTPANMTPSPALPLQGKGGDPRTGTNTGAVDGAGQRVGTPSDKTPSNSPLRGRTSQHTGTPSPTGEGRVRSLGVR